MTSVPIVRRLSAASTLRSPATNPNHRTSVFLAFSWRRFDAHQLETAMIQSCRLATILAASCGCELRCPCMSSANKWYDSSSRLMIIHLLRIIIVYHKIRHVRIGSTLSSSCMVTSGVPQGSVLGPILFNIFINDITDSVQDHVTVKLFADDVKLYSEIALPTDIVNFQSCLDKIQTWAVTWKIGISYSKCNIMELGPKPSHTKFLLSNKQIQTTSITKGLGRSIRAEFKIQIPYQWNCQSGSPAGSSY